MGLGQLICVAKPHRAAISSADPYPPLIFKSFMSHGGLPAEDSLKQSMGFLYRFHRAVDEQSLVRPVSNWEQLLGMMFPEDEREVSLRWIPEFVGSIAMQEGDSPCASVAQQGADDIEISSIDGAKHIKLAVHADFGWRVHEGEDDHRPAAFVEVQRGQCRVSTIGSAVASATPVLELMVAGNCPVGFLMGWNGASKGDALLFDSAGAPVPGKFTWSNGS
jgi:hypothetical protein